MSLQSQQKDLPLHDNHDGSYRGDLPQSWTGRVSDLQFNKSALSEFIRLKRWQAGVAIPFAASLTSDMEPMCSDKDKFYTCPLQLFVQPPDCRRQLGSLGVVDSADVSSCRCLENAFVAGSVGTAEGGKCIAHCPRNQQRGNLGDGHGDACFCMKGTYNSTRFNLHLLPGGGTGCMLNFEPSRAPSETDVGLVCKPCPPLCTRCDSLADDVFDGVPTIKEGWRVVRGGA
eukprot:COSAG01_NODE_3820_length_5664_cov_3.383827_2_plen_229_part_00